MQIVFLTSGIFMDPTADVFRKKLESLSEFSSGYVFGVVYRGRVKSYFVGRYQVLALHLPLWMRGYSTIPSIARLVTYIGFVLVKCVWLAYARRTKIDFIVACDTFKTGFLAYVLSRIINSQFAVEVSGNYQKAYDANDRSTALLSRFKSKLVNIVSPMVLRAADAVKLLYPGQVDCFVDQSELGNVSIFHNVMPLEAFSNQQCERKFILLVGHPWFLKGVDLAIDAFSRLAKTHCDWTLRIVGFCADPSPFIERAATAEGQIEFEPSGLPYHAMIGEICKCSVLLLPSRTEAMGRVLLEAMAASKPIVASRVDGIPTYVRDGIDGLLFEPESVVDLAQKLSSVLRDPVLRSTLGSNGYQHVHTELNEQQYVAKYRSLLARAVQRLPSDPA